MRGVVRFLAAGGGLGFIPFMPGTWGSVGGIALLVFFSRNWLALGLVVGASLILAQVGEVAFASKDPPQVVVDEIAGMFLAGFGLKPGLWPLAFVLFRFFDIVKPGFLRSLQRLPGGAGVMADDLAAGLLTNALLVLGERLFLLLQ
ncbi:MAG: phosphatidylglycerophosphatase [Eubacteriales bacterium]|nr:phosphatidylglycerophosphatase [Eubacteriales bacterium]